MSSRIPQTNDEMEARVREFRDAERDIRDRAAGKYRDLMHRRLRYPAARAPATNDATDVEMKESE